LKERGREEEGTGGTGPLTQSPGSAPVFLVFNHDFIIHTDFTHITASNTATDDLIY